MLSFLKEILNKDHTKTEEKIQKTREIIEQTTSLIQNKLTSLDNFKKTGITFLDKAGKNQYLKKLEDEIKDLNTKKTELEEQLTQLSQSISLKQKTTPVTEKKEPAINLVTNVQLTVEKSFDQKLKEIDEEIEYQMLLLKLYSKKTNEETKIELSDHKKNLSNIGDKLKELFSQRNRLTAKNDHIPIDSSENPKLPPEDSKDTTLSIKLVP